MCLETNKRNKRLLAFSSIRISGERRAIVDPHTFYRYRFEISDRQIQFRSTCRSICCSVQKTETSANVKYRGSLFTGYRAMTCLQ